MKAIIVEDSRLARKEIAELLKAFDDISIEAEAENAEDAERLIKSKDIDLIFLDINLPGGTGFDLVEKLEDPPFIIFTTAYDEYAIKSFEYNTLDYLLKPIKKEPLERAVNKARQVIAASITHETGPRKKIFVKDGEKFWFVNTEDIMCFESEGNYTRIYFKNNKPLIYKSLNQIEAKVNPSIFFRVSRTHIVNLNFIKSAKEGLGNTIKLILENNLQVNVSRRNAQKLKSFLSF
jgi:two-component system LytT family response regulator